MRPFMRRTDRGPLALAGWVAEPAGRWDGHDCNIVYDPRRHQLVRARGSLTTAMKVALAAAGFRCVARDEPGRQELWARDRTAATHPALRRPGPAAQPGPPGLAR